MTAFEEMGVIPEIARAVDELEWTLPTDVQAEAIPLILGGGDVLMAAETGSGKTGAFCLPILQITWETLKDLETKKGGGSAPVATTPWSLSFWDRDAAMAVTPDGLRCQSRAPNWQGCRATKAVQGGGKYYYESTVTDEGLCRVGWSLSHAALDLGTDASGYGFGGTGKKSNNRNFDNYGESFGIHDVIGCFLDLDSGEVAFSKNGKHLGAAFRLDGKMISKPFFPAVVLKNAEMSFNFGGTPFKHPPTDGYVGVSKAHKEHVKVAEGTTAAVVKDAPQAIIIEPSRELAEQTYNQIMKFGKYVEKPVVRSLLLTGGVNVNENVTALGKGIDIVVGTPGRLEVLISNGYLSLKACRFFVLDEADGLLKQGYGSLIDQIHKQIPKISSDGSRLQMIVCSATLHDFDVKKMAERLMHFPTWVDLKGEDAVPETVHHVVVMVDPQKDRSWGDLRKHIMTDGVHGADNVRPGNNTAVVCELNAENVRRGNLEGAGFLLSSGGMGKLPFYSWVTNRDAIRETLSEAVKMLKGEYCVRAINEHKMDKALIFCRTKLDCDNLEKYFNQLGGGRRNPTNPYSCVCLHGDRKPAERKENLEIFKAGEVKFLICTDVAARGLDITGLPFMINVTLPDEKSNYVHRIGRVGRAERMGLAISLVSSVPEKVWFHGEWCRSRGKNCHNTKLTSEGGCCIWYNEPNYLAEIEDHLNVTIQQVEHDIKVPVNDFDGKVVYGEKRGLTGSAYENHVAQMAPAVRELAQLESDAQLMYLRRHVKQR